MDRPAAAKACKAPPAGFETPVPPPKPPPAAKPRPARSPVRPGGAASASGAAAAAAAPKQVPPIFEQGSLRARGDDEGDLGAVPVNDYPACPKCRGWMTVRTARKGGHFWGCQSYPRCDETRRPFERYSDEQVEQRNWT